MFQGQVANRHSCLNLYPCVIKVQSIDQSISQTLSLSLWESACGCVRVYCMLCLWVSYTIMKLPYIYVNSISNEVRECECAYRVKEGCMFFQIKAPHWYAWHKYTHKQTIQLNVRRKKQIVSTANISAHSPIFCTRPSNLISDCLIGHPSIEISLSKKRQFCEFLARLKHTSLPRCI